MLTPILLSWTLVVSPAAAAAVPAFQEQPAPASGAVASGGACPPLFRLQAGEGGAALLERFTSLRRLGAQPRPPGENASQDSPSPSPWPSASPAAATDMSLLADAIVGGDVQAPCEPGAMLSPAAHARAARRDHVAYQLLSIGYSAREAADIISGRITRRALDEAQRMLMAGQDESRVADFLDRQYRVRTMPPGRLEPDQTPGTGWDPLIERHARTHGVDPRLVRAVISVESANNPRARSRAGAIGLMQLMPLTARALGVDPWQPDENVEGGVRYLRQLLDQFGTIERALIAYNGGPGYAQRYLSGRVALYGETRAYVARIRQLLAR